MGEERVGIPLRVAVWIAADVARAGVAGDAGAGMGTRGRIAGAERHGARGEPDLDVGGRGLDAVACRQVDGVGQERAAAPPERVAVRVLGDHQADVRVGVAIE
jgi:hypothetical protein